MPSRLCSCLSSLLLVPALAMAAEDEPLPFPDMAPAVGDILESDYYDPGRIHPRMMVERALRALEGAEIALDAAWEGDRISISLGGDGFSVPAPEPGDIDDAMAILESLRDALNMPRFDATTRRDLVYQMLNGAMTSLDPHTLIMPPAPANEFSEDIAGEFFGVGAYLNQENGVIRIERVMPGLPAELAGVRDGDIILRVDGERTVGLSLVQAVHRIKGPKGTEVVLTVEREGADEPIDIPIIRDLIPTPTLVSWKRDGIGYVRLDEFNRNAARQLFTALIELQADGPLQGFVLDLRANGGGLLKQSHIIADFFLTHSKEVVRTVSLGREPQILQSGRRTLLDVPMIALVGPGSASAAEILSGALQKNDRAVVAGMVTYGKGTVQTVRRLRDDSQFKFTIQEYQLKDGVSIQERGVEPDLVLDRHAVTVNGRVDLLPYSYAREADQEFALQSDNTEAHSASLRLGWLAEYEDDEAARSHRISARDFVPDQEAMLVIDLLAEALAADGAEGTVAQAWLDDTVRQTTIDLLRPAVEARSAQEAADLSEALAAGDTPITWGSGEAVAPGSLSIERVETQPLAAGTDGELRFRISNPGEQAAGRLYGVVRADLGSAFWEEELVIGEVPAGDSVERSLSFDVPLRIRGGEERFTLELRQDGFAEAIAELPVVVDIEAAPRPRFSWSWRLLDTAADRESPLVLDRAARLRLTVTNDGDGASKPVMLYVFKDDDPFVSLQEGRFRLDAMEPGASATVDVPMVVTGLPPPGYKVGPPPSHIALQIRGEEDFPTGEDGRWREGFYYQLGLDVAGQGPGNGPTAGSVNKPALTLASIDRNEAGVSLTVQIADDNPRYLALFDDGDKTALSELDGSPTDTTQRFEITLGEGLNELQVVLNDADDVSTVLPLRLWGPEDRLAEAPVDAADEASVAP